MADKVSCGLLMYRILPELQFFLVHPGGPFFKNKNEGSWTIPKGLPFPDESLLDAAIREFQEETGIVPTGPYAELGHIVQKSGKVVHAWAFAGQWDSVGIVSNEFEIEWPPKSGRKQKFPEIDKAAWYTLEEALVMINPAQRLFLDRVANTESF